jgi:HTH-type transcriptional regulator, glycine betaine synthesis regulator
MTDNPLTSSRQHFILGLSRISEFWGFPRAMGSIYAALYLSPQPLSLDDLVEQVAVTKGAISTNVRSLERLGMVHRHLQIGERKDFYLAETDFWKIVRGILKEREKNEFDLALRSVDESLELLDAAQIDPEQAELARFYQKRMQSMQGFFKSLDHLVATLLALDELRLGALERFLKR